MDGNQIKQAGPLEFPDRPAAGSGPRGEWDRYLGSPLIFYLRNSNLFPLNMESSKAAIRCALDTFLE